MTYFSDLRAPQRSHSGQRKSLESSVSWRRTITNYELTVQVSSSIACLRDEATRSDAR